MDLIIDTSGVTFQVGRGFEPRLDREGNQRRDRAGGTNLPLYAVQLIAFDDGGAETILVTVATENPPNVIQGQSVRLERLVAMPWVQNGTNAVKVAYRANTVVPLAGKSPVPSPSSGN